MKSVTVSSKSATLDQLVLVSHHLCPYVQRSLITLLEKEIPHHRLYIDLASKPEWFLTRSPLGKVPLLLIGDTETLFESAVICEYLDETTRGSLHPLDPLEKAKHRSWIEFGSQLLNDIARLYNADTAGQFTECLKTIDAKLQQLEARVQLPYFAGPEFSVVDATFGPIFRYFDVLETYLPWSPFVVSPKISAWRVGLSDRPSVREAVADDYPERLKEFFLKRNSHLSVLIQNLDKDPGQMKQANVR